jgi:glutamate dehydrogenase (NADP+)
VFSFANLQNKANFALLIDKQLTTSPLLQTFKIFSDMNLEKIMADLEKKNPGQPEFLQAVKEVLETIEDVVNENPKYEAANIIERIIEPDRVIKFKVQWMDDKGNVQVNRGYRVQFNNAIGPYKGGCRFHPSVTEGGLKFLGFEQIFKNSLTTLPMGGAKGGSDFDPKGKSNAEIMRFCQAFMAELYKYIGPDTDIPAGDIGVGGREIGYMYGMYKKLVGTHNGVFTGKGRGWGGSLIRPEATGFGTVYFAEEMLKTRGESMKGKIVAVSGFGNVSWGSIIKATQLGARVVTISGPDGYVYDPDGISGEKIDYLLELRASNQDIVKPYTYEFPNAQFFEGKRPWEVKCDVALPCAIQNELNGQDAQNLVNNGVMCVSEGANMPCTPEAMEIFLKSKILYGPGKASNAGGVATSGLEQTQNAMKLNWTAEEVEAKLHQIMINIHEACVKYGKEEDGFVNYVKGSNVAGFIKVADAMIDQGVI